MEEEDYDVDLSSPPPDILDSANATTLDSLSAESKHKYQQQYDNFKNWIRNHNITNIAETTLLAYFDYNSKKFKPSTLWPQYSMLKATIAVNDNIQINKYSNLIAFIKRQSDGYKPNKSKTLSNAEINKFILKATDEKYLMIKVVLIMGIAGACRCLELKNMTIDDITDKGSIMIVNIPDSKTRKERVFTVAPGNVNGVNLLDLVRKYIALRPVNTPHRRLFVYYTVNKCTVQPVGINTISKIPAMIASFLGLADPKEFTGHCLRRSSALLLEYSGRDVFSLKCYGRSRFTTVAVDYMCNSMPEEINSAKNKTTDSSYNCLSDTSSTTLTKEGGLSRGEEKVSPSVNVPAEIDVSVSLEDLSLQCRTCTYVDMPTQINLAQPGKVNLLRLLEKLVGFTVQISEKGAFNICKACHSTLTKISNFSEMCVFTHKRYLYEVERKKSARPIRVTKTPQKRKSVTFSPDQPTKHPRLATITSEYLSSEETLSADEPSYSQSFSSDPTDPLALTDPLAPTDPLSLQKHTLQIKTPDQLNQLISPGTVFGKPCIRIFKTFDSKAPRKLTLSEPFPQTRLPVYRIQAEPTCRLKEPRRVQVNISDHTYTLKTKRKRVGVNMHSQLAQFTVSDVLQAINECKIAMDSMTVFCISCHCSADSISVMATHMRRDHAADYPKWCCSCNKIVADLVEHKKLRACSILYACKFCNRVFKKSVTLIHHLEYHNKDYFHPELCSYLSVDAEGQGRDVPDLIHVISDAQSNLKSAVKRAKNTENVRVNMDSIDSDNAASKSKSEDYLIGLNEIKQENVEDANLVLLTELHTEIQIKEEPVSDETIEEHREF